MVMSRRFYLSLTLSVLSQITPFFTADSQAQVITSGPPSCPNIALTFDLCPVRKGSGYDKALVDYLIDHEIPATFFMSGRWITRHDPEVTQLLGNALFEIGTHGEVHAHLPMHNADEQRREILGPVKRLSEHYSRDTKLFRPPYGEYDSTTVDIVKHLHLKFIQWNIESGDPDPTLPADQIVARIAQRVKPGSIIVLHANGKGKETRQIVQQLAQDVLPRKGLTPVTVSELLSCAQPSR